MLKANNEKYSIAVAGTGYVGLSMAVLLAQNNKITKKTKVSGEDKQVL